MPSRPDTPDSFYSLAARSRELHGHRYVLPVAAWILQSGNRLMSVRDVMVGLEGQADRPRVIEALARLAGFEALVELPRPPQAKAPRIFEWAENPYWDLVQSFLDELDTPVRSAADGDRG